MPLNRYTENFIEEYHESKLWVHRLQNIAKTRPVVFFNSYQNASKYQFYTHNTSTSMNNILGRKNQFNIWQHDTLFRNKNVVVVNPWYDATFHKISTNSAEIYYQEIDNFQSFGNIIISNDINKTSYEANQLINSHIEIETFIPINVEANTLLPNYLNYFFMQNNTIVSTCKQPLLLKNSMLTRTALKTEMDIEMPPKKGTYKLQFCIQSGWFSPIINNSSTEVNVK